MRRYETRTIQSNGDVATPDQIGNYLGILLEEMNGGLDRDNCHPGVIQVDRFTDDTFAKFDVSEADEGSSVDSYEVDPRERQGDWVEIDRVIEMTTGDGALKVYLNLTYDFVFPDLTDSAPTEKPSLCISFGVMVDGKLVASELGEAIFDGRTAGGSPETRARYSASVHVEGYLPVAAGEHRITGVFRVYNPFFNELYADDAIADIDLNNRCLVARYGGR